jgi:hypothetical protein
MSSKNVVLELPAAVYADLESLAEKEQTEPSEMVARLVKAAGHEPQAEPTTRAFRKILERATDLGVTDLAEQHDHYLYGTDKR